MAICTSQIQINLPNLDIHSPTLSISQIIKKSAKPAIHPYTAEPRGYLPVCWHRANHTISAVLSAHSSLNCGSVNIRCSHANVCFTITTDPPLNQAKKVKCEVNRNKLENAPNSPTEAQRLPPPNQKSLNLRVQMQKINLYKTLQMYKKLHLLGGEKKPHKKQYFYFVSHAFTLFGEN